MHALEGVRLIDFGQYLAGPFGPMIIGDLGAEVIKVEPVTGDGMRMASKPFFGCQRGKRDIALNLKTAAGSQIALELVARADIVHHNMTAGVAKRLGIGYDDCKRGQPRRRLLQHLGVRPRGSARALRRARPAVPGVGRARVRSRRGARRATRRSTTASACATRPTRCSRSSACLAALYHQRRTGEGQELWTSLLDGGAMFASDALLVDGEARAAAPSSTRARHGIDACYRLYETAGRLDPDRRGAADASATALCGALGLSPSSPTTRASPIARAARRAPPAARGAARAALRARRPRSSGRARSTTPACRTRSRVDTKAASSCSSTPTTSGSGSSPSTSTRSWAACASSASSSTSRRRPATSHGPPPLVGEHTRGDPRVRSATTTSADASDSRDEGIVYWPDEDFAWNYSAGRSDAELVLEHLAGRVERERVDHLARGAAPCSWPSARGTTRSSSSASIVAPGRGTTNAQPTSPMRSSGTPTTATCVTAGWSRIMFSISAGYALKPPTMNMSFLRSVMRRLPRSSSTPMSPVCSQPSASIASAVRFGIVDEAAHHVVAADDDLAGLAGRRPPCRRRRRRAPRCRGSRGPAVVEIVSASSSWRHIVAMPVASVSP